MLTVFIDFLNAIELQKVELDLNHFTTKLNQLEKSNVEQLLQHLFDELENGGKRVSFLEQKIVHLEDRFLEQERFSSEDPIIFEYAPIYNDKNYPLAKQMCDYFRKLFELRNFSWYFQGLSLGPWNTGNFAPAIIDKFTYFGEKSKIYKRKS